MKKFYGHLAAGRPSGEALASAKRELLRTFGPRMLPHQWAGFTIEGDGGAR
jgi:CHAT domain-containing protein